MHDHANQYTFSNCPIYSIAQQPFLPGTQLAKIWGQDWYKIYLNYDCEYQVCSNHEQHHRD